MPFLPVWHCRRQSAKPLKSFAAGIAGAGGMYSPIPYEAQDPPRPQNSLIGGPRPHAGGGAPDPKIFLGSLGSPNAYIIYKLGG